MKDIADLKARLHTDPERVCRHLLPGGKRHGAEWVCGDISGSPATGQGSFRVHLAGKKLGVWSDFQSGESGGDLLDLWQKSQRLTFSQTLEAAARWLGDPLNVPMPYSGAKQATKPKDPFTGTLAASGGAARNYLLQERRITTEFLAAYGVGGQEAVQFPFCSNAGKLAGIKSLKLERPGGKKQVFTQGDCHSLFGWPLVPTDCKTLIITEGEIDALTLHGAGVPFPVVSLPYGAGGGSKQRWIEAHWDRLEGVQEFVLALDDDEAGRATVSELGQRLGEHRCRVALPPAGMKDWNAALCAGVTGQQLRACVEGASPLDPAGLKNVLSFWDAVYAEFNPTPEQSGKPLPWRGLNFSIRPHELLIVSGLNGHGKSQLLGQLLLHLMADGQRGCLFSGEMPPWVTLARMLRQATTCNNPAEAYWMEAMTWLDERLWVVDRLGTAKTEELLALFEYAFKRYGCRYFVVDSLLKLGIREDDYDGQRAAIEALCAFKNQYPVTVLLVAHPRKTENEDKPPGKLDVRGGAAITDLADVVLTIWRNIPKAQTDPDNASKPDAMLYLHKDRRNGELGKISLWFDKFSGQFVSRFEDKGKRYVKYSALYVVNNEEASHRGTPDSNGTAVD